MIATPRVKKYAAVTAVLIIFTVGLLTLLNKHIGTKYNQVTSNTALLQAITKSDPQDVEKSIGKDYKIQKFVGSTITYSSHPSLPTPKITAFYQTPGVGVLRTSTQKNLASMQPYRQFINGGLYLVVPIIASPEQKSGYLVYTKVLL